MRTQRISVKKLVATLLLVQGIFNDAFAEQSQAQVKFKVLALVEAGGNHLAFTAAAKPWLKKCGEENGFEVDYLHRSRTGPYGKQSFHDIAAQLDLVGWREIK